MPVSTLPAPTSAKRVTPPSPASHSMLSRQRTRPVTCSTSSRRIASGSMRRPGGDVGDQRRARRGDRRRPPGPRPSRRPPAASAGSGTGAETFSGIARAPSSLAFSMAAVDRRLVAGDHHLAGVVVVGDDADADRRRRPRPPPRPARRRSWARSAPPSRPRPPARPAASPGRAASAAAPCRPGVSAPAAARAEYSPRRVAGDEGGLVDADAELLLQRRASPPG